MKSNPFDDIDLKPLELGSLEPLEVEELELLTSN